MFKYWFYWQLEISSQQGQIYFSKSTGMIMRHYSRKWELEHMFSSRIRPNDYRDFASE